MPTSPSVEKVAAVIVHLPWCSRTSKGDCVAIDGDVTEVDTSEEPSAVLDGCSRLNSRATGERRRSRSAARSYRADRKRSCCRVWFDLGSETCCSGRATGTGATGPYGVGENGA